MSKVLVVADNAKITAELVAAAGSATAHKALGRWCAAPACASLETVRAGPAPRPLAQPGPGRRKNPPTGHCAHGRSALAPARLRCPPPGRQRSWLQSSSSPAQRGCSGRHGRRSAAAAAHKPHTGSCP